MIFFAQNNYHPFLTNATKLFVSIEAVTGLTSEGVCFSLKGTRVIFKKKYLFPEAFFELDNRKYLIYFKSTAGVPITRISEIVQNGKLINLTGQPGHDWSYPIGSPFRGYIYTTGYQKVLASKSGQVLQTGRLDKIIGTKLTRIVTGTFQPSGGGLYMWNKSFAFNTQSGDLLRLPKGNWTRFLCSSSRYILFSRDDGSVIVFNRHAGTYHNLAPRYFSISAAPLKYGFLLIGRSTKESPLTVKYVLNGSIACAMQLPEISGSFGLTVSKDNCFALLSYWREGRTLFTLLREKQNKLLVHRIRGSFIIWNFVLERSTIVLAKQDGHVAIVPLN